MKPWMRCGIRYQQSNDEEYQEKAIASFPEGIRPSMTITMILAKSLALEEAQSCSHE